MSWNAAKGEIVLVHNQPEDLGTFPWYEFVQCTQMFKSKENSRAMNSISQGPAHSRKDTVYTNVFLLFQGTAEKEV